MMENAEKILEVKNLSTSFYTEEGIVPAVDDLSFSLHEHEILAIVGESGCGKSVTSLSIMQLIPCPPGKVEKGEILFEGTDLLKLSKEKMRDIRGDRISMIFQEPMTSLNPVFTIGHQLMDVFIVHRKMTRRQAREAAIEMLRTVRIPAPEKVVDYYPNQLSGGMRQRVMIAMALSCQPKILIADEPVSALDVAIQAQVLNLMCDLQDKYGLTYIFVSHNLSVVKHICNRIAVMYLGQFVELAESEEMFRHPMHPYTVGLMEAIPIPDPDVPSLLAGLEGDVPTPIDPPAGCRFRSRCPKATEECGLAAPEFRELTPGHFVACHHAG